MVLRLQDPLEAPNCRGIPASVSSVSSLLLCALSGVHSEAHRSVRWPGSAFLEFARQRLDIPQHCHAALKAYEDFFSRYSATVPCPAAFSGIGPAASSSFSQNCNSVRSSRPEKEREMPPKRLRCDSRSPWHCFEESPAQLRLSQKLRSALRS